MNRRKGFTLVELMVVILIVGILAAVAIPIMRGRIDAAKWSEGKAMMGTIATALRAYVAERNQDIGDITRVTFTHLGFVSGDLQGTYFGSGNFQIVAGAYDMPTNALTFTIHASAGTGISAPKWVRLNQSGQWVEGNGIPPTP
jgi:type IV pilus assembly protein PilA